MGGGVEGREGEKMGGEDEEETAVRMKKILKMKLSEIIKKKTNEKEL